MTSSPNTPQDSLPGEEAANRKWSLDSPLKTTLTTLLGFELELELVAFFAGPFFAVDWEDGDFHLYGPRGTGVVGFFHPDGTVTVSLDSPKMEIRLAYRINSDGSSGTIFESPGCPIRGQLEYDLI